MINRDKCELCGSANSDWKALFNKNNFSFVKCEKCKLIFTKEIPSTEELEIAYSEQYFNGDIYNNYTEASMQKKRWYVSLLSNFQSLTGNKTGTILEVGCATGFFLDAAKFLEYETYGIEISTWASKIAMEKGHKVLNISINDILNSEFKNIKYDCIFMWDVFEHLTSPREVLENLNAILKPNGHIMINTLNVGSPTVKFLSKKWSHYFPPFHLSFFDLKTMKLILEKTGFDLINQKTAGPLFYDDYINKYYVGGFLFKKRIIQKVTNKLKLGYVQTIIAKKNQISPIEIETF